MKLILLRCPNCSQPLKPGNEDVVLACENCHTPVAIATNGPVKLAVQFARPANNDLAQVLWMPFWVISGKVDITNRATQGGGSRTNQAQEFWAQERRFFVPAWDLDSQMAQGIGSRLLDQEPVLERIVRPQDAHLQTAVVTPNDAKKLIEFIVLAVEARRRDWLRNLDFELRLDEPELWALPEHAY
jgi:hypothetical protein